MKHALKVTAIVVLMQQVSAFAAQGFFCTQESIYNHGEYDTYRTLYYADDRDCSQHQVTTYDIFTRKSSTTQSCAADNCLRPNCIWDDPSHQFNVGHLEKAVTYVSDANEDSKCGAHTKITKRDFGEFKRKNGTTVYVRLLDLEYKEPGGKAENFYTGHGVTKKSIPKSAKIISATKTTTDELGCTDIDSQLAFYVDKTRYFIVTTEPYR